MTLATGASDLRKSGSQAFTLIEMILVVALLAIAVSMVSPRLSTFIRARSLESEARRILAVTHAGRARAVSEGRTLVLWLDAEQGRYGLERETLGQEGDTNALEFTWESGLQVSFDTSATLIGQTATSRRTPTTPSVSSSSRPSQQQSRLARNQSGIRLLPDGTIDEESPQAIEIRDLEGGTLWVVQGSDRRHYEIQTSNR